MGEPGQELFDGKAGPEFPDSRAKLLLGVDGEMAQLALDVQPPQFDGVQVRAAPENAPPPEGVAPTLSR